MQTQQKLPISCLFCFVGFSTIAPTSVVAKLIHFASVSSWHLLDMVMHSPFMTIKETRPGMFGTSKIMISRNCYNIWAKNEKCLFYHHFHTWKPCYHKRKDSLNHLRLKDIDSQHDSHSIQITIFDPDY